MWIGRGLKDIFQHFHVWIYTNTRLCVLVARCRLSLFLLFFLLLCLCVCVFSLCIWWLRRVASCQLMLPLLVGFVVCWPHVVDGCVLACMRLICIMYMCIRIVYAYMWVSLPSHSQRTTWYISHYTACVCKCIRNAYMFNAQCSMLMQCALHFSMCHFIYDKLHTKLCGCSMFAL